MRYRKLDDTLDYTFGRKPEDAFYKDSEAVVQAIVTRLNLLLGEWWEDLDDGLPLFQKILGHYNDSEDIDLIVTDRILGTEGVKSLADIRSALDTARKYTYSSAVETTWGERELLALGFDGIHFVRLKTGR